MVTIGRRAQTATEYLIILSVVLVIAVVATASSIKITSIGGSAKKTSTDLTYISYPIGIADYFVDSLGYLGITFRNNIAATSFITNVTTTNGTCIPLSVNYPIQLLVGQQKLIRFYCSDSTRYTGLEGSQYSFNTYIAYTDTKTNGYYTIGTSQPIVLSGEVAKKIPFGVFFNTVGGAYQYNSSASYGAAGRYSWNNLYGPGDNNYTTTYIANYSDGTSLGTITAHMWNLGGGWGNVAGMGATDLMYNGFAYPSGNNVDPSWINFTGIPKGSYEVVVYGVADNTQLRDYSITANGITTAVKNLSKNGLGDTLSYWQEDENYIKFRGITVGTSGTIQVYSETYGNTEASLSGIQMVRIE